MSKNKNLDGYDPDILDSPVTYPPAPAQPPTPTDGSGAGTTTGSGGYGGYGGGGAASGGDIGSLIAPFQQPFNAPPMVNLGGPTPIAYIPPTPQFHAPTGADVLNEPGYQFRLGQGEQALQQSAAARGVLNTGGTLKDVLDYGQNFASNEYGNVWNRAYQAFQPEMVGYQTQAQAGQRQNELNYSDAYNKWLQDYQIYRNQQLDTFNKQYNTTIA